MNDCPRTTQQVAMNAVAADEYVDQKTARMTYWMRITQDDLTLTRRVMMMMRAAVEVVVDVATATDVVDVTTPTHRRTTPRDRWTDPRMAQKV